MKNNEDILNIAIDRMHSALNSYYVWKWIEQSRNIHIGEETAKKNLEIINKYKFFFIPVFINSYKGFVTDLSIFYDSEKYPETFSLGKFIKILEDKLTQKELEEVKKEISEIKSRHNISIGTIRELRSKDVVHQSLEIKKNVINFKEIEELFDGTQVILNLISTKYNNSITSWNHVKKDINKDMKLLFNNLERGEMVRLDKIRKKWNT